MSRREPNQKRCRTSAIFLPLAFVAGNWNRDWLSQCERVLMGRFRQATAIKRFDNEVLCEVAALNAVIIASWPDIKEMFSRNVFRQSNKPELKHLRLLSKEAGTQIGFVLHYLSPWLANSLSCDRLIKPLWTCALNVWTFSALVILRRNYWFENVSDLLERCC